MRGHRVGMLIGLVAMASSAACGDYGNPASTGPPRIDARIEQGASEGDVFATLGRFEPVDAGIKTMEVDMAARRVVIKLTSGGVPSRHEARRALLAILREPSSAIRVTRINWNPA